MRSCVRQVGTNYETSTIANAREELPKEVSEALAADISAAWLYCRSAIQSGDKQAIRNFHLLAKSTDRSVNYQELIAKFQRRKSYFPNAIRIDPARIDPVLVPVRPRTLEEELFKITRGYWSMPYSKGYGRRLRFVLMDAHHEAVIGIIGLQSPSADLACRDDYLSVPKSRKLSVVNNTLEAYTIGATPCYAPLLAGKLVAGYLHSEFIRREYWRIYGGKITTQLKNKIPQPLLAITTSSAFGRSSIYNRLLYKKQLLARPLGFTKGFGTIHLEQVYPRLLSWLKISGRDVPAGFGNGPKVRWQNVMRGLSDLGVSREYLEHGLKREVFIFELVTNLLEVCQNDAIPDMLKFDDGQWSEFWRERWCLPRATRNPLWNTEDSQNTLLAALKTPNSGAALL